MWSLIKLKEEIGEPFQLITIFGCGKNGQPKNEPASYYGLRWGEKLDKAEEDGNEYVRVYYKTKGDTEPKTQRLLLSEFKHFPEMEMFYTGAAYYLIFSNVGVLPWSVDKDGLTPKEIVKIREHIALKTKASLESIIIYPPFRISKHTYDQHSENSKS